MKITLIQPDDWHIHLREGLALKRTVEDVSKQFARAIVMPNLTKPIVNLDLAIQYFKNIKAYIPSELKFTPLMTLYLTDQTTDTVLKAAKNSTIIYGCKLYPAGATTLSETGITKIEKAYPIFEVMEKIKLPLLIHGEVTDPAVDVFDREKVFIEKILIPLYQSFPNLKIVLEHITTQEAVEFVKTTPPNIGATITAHHLLLNRNSLFQGGINPHHYCLPVLKRDIHQKALIEAATSGNSKFFLGTDSAPHAISKKENCHGCAGIYTAHAAIELYTEVFEKAGALDKFEAFASFHGADFYGLPRNTTTITLVKESWVAPETLSFGNEQLRPFRGGEAITWKLATANFIE